MNKIVMIVFGIMFCSCLVFAAGTADWFTGSLPNGRFVVGNEEDNVKMDATVLKYYLKGVIDCAQVSKTDLMENYYPGLVERDIQDVVTNFFLENPDQRDRTVVDVVLSGCK